MIPKKAIKLKRRHAKAGRLKACPICKNELRRGCYNACKHCYYTLECREIIGKWLGLFQDKVLRSMGRTGVSVRWHWYRNLVRISMEETILVPRHIELDPWKHETSGQAIRRTIGVSREVDVTAAMGYMDPAGAFAQDLMNMILELDRKVGKESSYTDINGKRVSIGGASFPAVGPWSDRLAPWEYK